MKEIYKDIKNYEGYYQVSNLGNIKSLDRYDSAGKLRKGRIRKVQIDEKKKCVSLLLTVNKVSTIRTVQSLVAEVFLGDYDNDNFIVEHVDKNFKNNKLDNLKIISKRELAVKSNKARSSRKGKLTGAYYSRSLKKYISKCFIDGKQNHLGVFETEVEAHNEYLKALKKLGQNE